MNLVPQTLKFSNRTIFLTSSGIITVLSLTHLASDAISHIFSALLPTFQERFGLTETVLALLVATLSFSALVTQPFFGALADRVGQRKVAALGVILSAALLSLIGIVPTIYLLFGLLLVGGLGSAAFHPAGASLARLAGGEKGELAVSLFSAGGTVGVALGPVIVLVIVSKLGLSFTPWLMIPAVVLGLLMFIVAPSGPAVDPSTKPTKIIDVQLLAGPVGLLTIVGILGTIAYVTFSNAIPLWLVQNHNLSPDNALIGWTLAAFALSAALGGIGAGLLSRRISQRVIVIVSLLSALLPLFIIFRLEPGTLLYFLMVMLAGVLLHASLPLLIVSAQDLAPDAASTAAGMLMGFAGGMAGIIYIGVGRLQELFGVTQAMSLSYFTLIPAALLAFYALTKYRAEVEQVRQAPINVLSCVCSPGLSANLNACPCRIEEQGSDA
jgi:FSR family fosmidomycin resistance protein-like MFS transporter